MTHRTRTRPASFLLALFFLALPICPAVADTPSTSPVAANPTIYDEVREGKPGALQKLQLQLMTEMFASSGRAYSCQTGSPPASPEAILEAGLLPFRPVSETGESIPIVTLTDQELPKADAIGLRSRSSDFTLIRMGADGDPLTPMVETLKVLYYQDQHWIAPYPWAARQARCLEATLLSLCSAYYKLEGTLPQSSDQLLARLQLTPVDVEWQDSSTPPACGVTLEVDSTGQFVRTVRYPDPGWGQTMTYALRAGRGGSYLDISPAVLAQRKQWESLGTLVPSAPTPALLAVWSPPVVNPEEEIRKIRVPLAEYLVLKDLKWYASWYAEKQGIEPSTEWLIREPRLLHRLLDAEQQPLPLVVAPYPLPPDLKVTTP